MKKLIASLGLAALIVLGSVLPAQAATMSQVLVRPGSACLTLEYMNGGRTTACASALLSNVKRVFVPPGQALLVQGPGGTGVIHGAPRVGTWYTTGVAWGFYQVTTNFA